MIQYKYDVSLKIIKEGKDENNSTKTVAKSEKPL